MGYKCIILAILFSKMASTKMANKCNTQPAPSSGVAPLRICEGVSISTQRKWRDDAIFTSNCTRVRFFTGKPFSFPNPRLPPTAFADCPQSSSSAKQQTRAFLHQNRAYINTQIYRGMNGRRRWQSNRFCHVPRLWGSFSVLLNFATKTNTRA